MTNMALIEATKLDALTSQLERIERKLDGATITPRPDWITIKEAAELLDVTPDTIRRRRKTGAIEARSSGKCRLVKLTD